MMPGEQYIKENDFLVMDMNEGVGSTYRYYSGDHQLYDFTYGNLMSLTMMPIFTKRV